MSDIRGGYGGGKNTGNRPLLRRVVLTTLTVMALIYAAFTLTDNRSAKTSVVELLSSSYEVLQLNEPAPDTVDVEQIEQCNSRRDQFAKQQLERYYSSPIYQLSATESNNKTAPLLLYNATYDFVEGCLVLWVQEYRDGKPAGRGGTSFNVVANDDFGRVYNCAVNDTDEGTYVVFCPTFQRCLKVSLILLYYDYEAFFEVIKSPENQTVLVVSLCNSRAFVRSLEPAHYTGWIRREDRVWSTIKGTHRRPAQDSKSPWIWVDQGRYEVPSRPELRRCLLEDLSSIIGFGDSHMMFTIYYFRQLIEPELFLEHNPQASGTTLYSGKIGCSYAGIIEEATRFAANFCQTPIPLSTQVTPRDVVAFCLGYADLMYQGLRYFASESLITYSSRLLAMAQSERWRNSTVVLFSMLPTPNGGAFNGVRHGRNNVATSAAIGLLVETLARNNITFTYFDAYGMIMPRVDEIVDEHHYLQPAGLSFEGEVGLTVADVFLGRVCKLAKVGR